MVFLAALRERWKSFLLPEYFILYVSVAYFLLLVMIQPSLATVSNLRNLFSNLLPLLIVAVGQTFVLITAGIDLSVTSTISLASVMGAAVMTGENSFYTPGTPLAAGLGVAVMGCTGLAMGLVNGAAITLFRMPPFIVTLTTMMFFRGSAIWFTQSRNIFNLPPAFNALGSGGILGIPYALWIAAGVAGVGHYLLHCTVLGRWLYAVGHNPKTARVSGVPVSGTIWFAYTFSGLCGAAAAVLYTARIETGSPTLGDKILLDVIGAAVIGGTSLFGGKGKVSWTVYGVLFITLIDNTLTMLGLTFFVIMMVKGGVILFAALLDAVRVRIREGR
ncbi:MAG: ABC transporter permease [bacterium]